MRSNIRTTEFVGLEFADASYADVATELERLTTFDKVSLVVTPNVEHVVMLLDETGPDEVGAQFKRAYDAATLRLCDSRVLRTLAWFRGVRLKVITGSDLTAMLFEQGWLIGKKVALIGGDEKMLAELNTRYPETQISQHIPPMAVLENEPAIQQIELFVGREQWDYILFAIGAPRSEIIAHRIISPGDAKGVAICVGASIEFLLGRKVRAPRWMQIAGIEWMFRLFTEPRRLWRRYLVNGPRIFLHVRNWHR